MSGFVLSSDNPSLHQLSKQISEDMLKKHVQLLGSDLLEGRGTGTRGGEMAADYIAHQLRKYKLKPIGDNETFFQPIPMHGSIPLNSSDLKLVTPTRTLSFNLGQDYLLYKTGAQTFIPQPIPLVFVGYGIIAPEYDYNDYQSVDVGGKIVVFLSGEPLSDDPDYFMGGEPTIFSYPESKQRLAISKGAFGSIMIPLPEEMKCQSWDCWIRKFSFENITLVYAVTGNLSVVMNPIAALELFEGNSINLNQIYNKHHTNSMRSFPLNVKISFHGKFIERDFFSSNVLGMLTGKKKDSYIIISAHYDHLGIGLAVTDDIIYNGVVDNAIGVSAVLEIARVLSQLPQKTRHSIIFLLTTGEEKGLLGSTYYLSHLVSPLYQTIANINVDGLAIFDTFNDVVGIGAELSTLGDMLNNVVRDFGLQLSSVPSQFLMTESFARSDQISFAKAGVPAILIAEGLQYKNTLYKNGLQRFLDWNRYIYHTPYDDLNQPLNFQAALQHCKIILAFSYFLANSEKLPEWKPGTPFINARLQSIAERR